MEVADEGDLWCILEELRLEAGEGGAPLSPLQPRGIHVTDRPRRAERAAISHRVAAAAAAARTGPASGGAACESCGSGDMMVKQGEHVCRACNVVQARVIDTGAEWRFFGHDDRGADPTRCGLPTNNLLPRSSLGSMVGGRWNDSKDNRRLRQFQMWNSMPYWERTLYHVFEKLAAKASRHSLPGKVLEAAKDMFKRASELKVTRGETKDGLIASCIYHACALNKVPRSPKEIAAMFDIDAQTLTKGNARFQALLNLTMESGGPDDYIMRFGSRLNMDYEDIVACKALTRAMDEALVVSDFAPTSAAAAALHYYCLTREKRDVGRDQIAQACGVSQATVLKCYKQIALFRHLFDAAT